MADTARRQKFQQFIAAKWKNVHCEICGVNKWSIPEEDKGLLSYLPNYQAGGAMVIGGPVIPVFLAICENCGNIRRHAAALVDPDVLKGS